MRIRILSVIDGDSFRVHACVWPGSVIYDLIIRLYGVDTPKTRGAKCPREAEAGQEAKDRLTQLVGRTVRLKRIRRDKYSGRFIAQVYTGEEVHVSVILLQERLAGPYPVRAISLAHGARSHSFLLTPPDRRLTKKPLGSKPSGSRSSGSRP